MLLILIQTIYIITNVIIGLYDFSFYRIPNALLGFLIALYVIYAPFYLELESIVNSAIVCAIVLVVTFTLFATKIIGGGDAKYLTVTSLWVGSSGVIPFIILFSLLGGLLAIIYLVLRDYVQRFSDWIWINIQKAEENVTFLQLVWSGSGTGAELGKRENISARMLPYGIAIATAAIIMMVYNPLTVL